MGLVPSVCLVCVGLGPKKNLQKREVTQNFKQESELSHVTSKLDVACSRISYKVDRLPC